MEEWKGRREVRQGGKGADTKGWNKDRKERETMEEEEKENLKRGKGKES